MGRPLAHCPQEGTASPIRETRNNPGPIACRPENGGRTMAAPGTPADVDQLWRATLEKVKVRLVLPSVWRAMEAGRPLVIEGDWFVLGFPASRSQEAGMLNDSKTRNIIERA